MEISADRRLSKLFETIGQITRLKIMLVIADGEAGVCHLEAALGIRQATISQHLMVLRAAGLVKTKREGRNIYYRLARPELFDAICQAARVIGLNTEILTKNSRQPLPDCTCPRCKPDLDPELSCQNNETK